MGLGLQMNKLQELNKKRLEHAIDLCGLAINANLSARLEVDMLLDYLKDRAKELSVKYKKYERLLSRRRQQLEVLNKKIKDGVL